MNSISELLNNIIAQGYIYFNVMKNKISNLTPLQQKVTIVALAVITGLTLIYLTCRCCCFKAKRVESEETELQLLDVVDEANFAEEGENKLSSND